MNARDFLVFTVMPDDPLCVFGFAETALVNQAPAQSWGLGSNGTENQRKHELEFALLVCDC